MLDNRGEGKGQTDGLEKRPTIGLFVEDTAGGSEYQFKLWNGVADALKSKGNLICFPGGSLGFAPLDEFDRMRNVLYELANPELVDGLIISGTLGNYIDPEKFQNFHEEFISLKKVGVVDSPPGVPIVAIDNTRGMRELMTHLIQEHGYQRIAFICGPEKNTDAKQRLQTYKDILEKFGIPIDESLIVPGNFLAPAGKAAVYTLLDERKVGFRAIVAANDNMAFGAIEALQERGIRVPENVAVVGFDDVEEAQAINPSLTTVRYSAYAQGKRAAEMLLDLISGKEVPDRVVLPTKLKIRQSCGCTNLAVEQAKSGITTRPQKTIRAAITTQKKNILNEILTVIEESTDNGLSGYPERLVDAFLNDLKGEEPESFINILNETLHKVSLASGDISAWHAAISIIRLHLLPTLGDDQWLIRCEDLCNQARVLIGDLAQQELRHRRLLIEKWASALGEISQKLVTTSNEQKQMQILADGLKRLGIPRCYICQYENPAAIFGKWRLILDFEDGQVIPGTYGSILQPSELVRDNFLPQSRLCNLVVEPLFYQKNQIGLAVFEVGPLVGTVYETLRGHISSALWETRLVQYLHSLYKASSEITALRDPQEILDKGVDKVCEAIGACSAQVILVTNLGQIKRLAEGGSFHNFFKTSILANSNKIAFDVMRDCEPVLFEDLNEKTFEDFKAIIEAGMCAMGCFPLRLRGKAIGVIWVYFKNPYHFPEIEVDALRIYFEQIAIAYDNARRMKELEHLRQAAEKLASVTKVNEVLLQITRSAREVLVSDSVVIWPYDSVREAFLPEGLVADGVRELDLAKFRATTPRPKGGTASLVMEKGYLEVSDVKDIKFTTLIPPGNGLRDAIEVRSFQGIELQVDAEPLGVLYVNYTKPQIYDDRDKTTLEAFAYLAAMALKKARLMEQVIRVNKTARIVADISVLEELSGTLKAIAQGTMDGLNSDTVTLYTFDQAKDKVGFPPTMVGVIDEKSVLQYGYVSRDSLIYKILALDDLYAAVDSQNDLIMKGPFVIRESIKSAVGIPLIVNKERVGVMFVNYRVPHHFTGEELADIRLFSNQAAVAIRNAHLYEKATRNNQYLEILYQAGMEMTGSLDIDEIFNCIARQARTLTGLEGKPANLIHLGLFDGRRINFKAWSPEPSADNHTINTEDDLPIGIMGRAVKTGQSQLVFDIAHDSNYINYDPNTRSELAVPIKSGHKVIGIINVEHTKLHGFDENDQRFLEALSMQTALAVQNAQTYAELKQQYNNLEKIKGMVGSSTALDWMRMVSGVWGHSIKREVGKALVSAEMVKRACNKYDYPKALNELVDLELIVKGIGKIPITAPLSAEDAISSVKINRLIQGYLGNVWRHAQYKAIELLIELQPDLDDQVTVRASEEWIRRGLEIVVDNAIQAMIDANSKIKQLKVTTRLRDGKVVILIRDSGPGISEDIKDHLFEKPIDKPQGSRGAGVGLVLARNIFNTYQGNITLLDSGISGTTMSIVIPVEHPNK